MKKQKRELSELSSNVEQDKSKKVKHSSQALVEHLIICGSYEKAIFGIKLDEKLTPIFVSMGHSSCVKAVAVSNHLMATSSTDETLKLYNLRKRHLKIS